MEVYLIKLKEVNTEYKKIYDSLEKINEAIEKISWEMKNSAYVNVKKILSQVKNSNQESVLSLKAMEKTLESIIRTYDKTEKEILSYANGIYQNKTEKTQEIETLIHQIAEKTILGKYIDVQRTSDFLVAEGQISTGIASIIADGSMRVAEGQILIQGKPGFVLGKADFLKAEGEITGGIPSLYEMIDLVMNPGKEKMSETTKIIGVSGLATASVLSAETALQIGTEAFNYHQTKKGSLLGVTADGGMGVLVEGKDIGIQAGVDAEAYLAKGEIVGGFTIFGIDIEIAAEGMIGVQAEAGFSLNKDGFSVEGGIGPVGIDVVIDWSDLQIGGF